MLSSGPYSPIRVWVVRVWLIESPDQALNNDARSMLLKRPLRSGSSRKSESDVAARARPEALVVCLQMVACFDYANY